MPATPATPATPPPPLACQSGFSPAAWTAGAARQQTLAGPAPALRRVAYAAALALAVAVVLQCGLALTAHERSRSHQELLGQAQDLPRTVQTLGREAALLALWQPGREARATRLKQLLAEAADEAQALPQQWAAAQWGLPSAQPPAQPAVVQALENWQTVSLRLQAHGHALATLRVSASAGVAIAAGATAATPAATPTATTADEAELQHLQRSFQAEVEPALQLKPDLDDAKKDLKRLKKG